jgi:hypothetical protein
MMKYPDWSIGNQLYNDMGSFCYLLVFGWNIFSGVWYGYGYGYDACNAMLAYGPGNVTILCNTTYLAVSHDEVNLLLKSCSLYM